MTKQKTKKVLRAVLILWLISAWVWPGWWVGRVEAGNTGALTAGGNAAVTSSAGDNDGFETNPTNTTSDDNNYAVSTNSGTAASTNCALPNTDSDQHDFTTFGVSLPAGSKVTGIAVSLVAKYDSPSGTNTICAFLTYDGGSNWTAGKNTADINFGESTNTLGSSSDLWGRSAWSSTELNDSNFKVRLMSLVAADTRDLSLDQLTVTIYYNEAPAVPTQDSPADAATGVSVTPTFTMTATDPDSDKLGYKVIIYSNSGCTTVVQTNDQASSSTGWSGTNASCTANPTSCYTSGTQGTFLTQTSLSNSTQYWWKASAKDPDGSTSFTDSSTCKSFTTASSATLTFSLSDNSIGFGTLGSGAARYATGDASGSASETVAHTLTASTNATSGYVITVQGATLRSGAYTVTAIGGTSAASSPGSEQFGLRITASGGDGSVTSPYDHASNYAYAANVATTDEIASDADGDDVSTTYSVRYLGNIGTATEAGSYSTTLTYVITAVF